MSGDHRDDASRAIRFLVDRMNDKKEKQNGVVYPGQARIFYSDLAKEIYSERKETDFDALTVRFPLGLIKFAVRRINHDRPALAIPDIQYLVVNKNPPRLANEGASFFGDKFTPKKQQDEIVDKIRKYKWTPDVVELIVTYIHDGPKLLSKEWARNYDSDTSVLKQYFFETRLPPLLEEWRRERAA